MVFPHSGGAETKGDQIVGRRCYLGRVGSDFAQPESTGGALKQNDHGEPSRANGSVALVISPPEPTAHTGNFRTSKRSASLGESFPICARWRFFIRTKRRLSAANKSGGDAISKYSAPFRFGFAGVDPVKWKKHSSGRQLRGRGHFGGFAIACSPADLPLQEGTERRSRTN